MRAHSVIGLSARDSKRAALSVKKGDVLLLLKEPNVHEGRKRRQRKRERENGRERPAQAGRRAAPAGLITTTRGALIGTRTRGSGLRVAARSRCIPRRSQQETPPPSLPSSDIPASTHIYARDCLSFHLTSRNPMYLSLYYFPPLLPFPRPFHRVFHASRRNTGMYKQIFPCSDDDDDAVAAFTRRGPGDSMNGPSVGRG